jgi:hypothetical protein
MDTILGVLCRAIAERSLNRRGQNWTNDVEPHDFGKRAVREIFDRLQSAGMTSFFGDAWLSTAATRQL